MDQAEGEGHRPAPAVGCDRDARAAFGEQGAAVFVVNAAEPERALVHVGLVALRDAVGQALRAKLDAGVGAGDAAEAELRGEFKVGDLALPPDEFVLREFLAGGDGAGDRSVLDAPAGGVALPAVKRAAVEDRLRAGRGGASGRGENRKQGEVTFHDGGAE